MKDGLNKVKIKHSKTEESSRGGEGGIYKTHTRGFSAGRDHLGGCWSRGGYLCTLSQSSPRYLYASGDSAPLWLLSNEQGNQLPALAQNPHGSAQVLRPL